MHLIPSWNGVLLKHEKRRYNFLRDNYVTLEDSLWQDVVWILSCLNFEISHFKRSVIPCSRSFVYQKGKTERQYLGWLSVGIVTQFNFYVGNNIRESKNEERRLRIRVETRVSTVIFLNICSETETWRKATRVRFSNLLNQTGPIFLMNRSNEGMYLSLLVIKIPLTQV